MNNSTEIRPNFKDGILRTFVSSKKKQHKLWNEYIPLSQTLQLFWGWKTQKTPQLIAVTQENFCQNMTITDYYCDENNLFI
jgi:IS1 family transposase